MVLLIIDAFASVSAMHRQHLSTTHRILLTDEPIQPAHEHTQQTIMHIHSVEAQANGTVFTASALPTTAYSIASLRSQAAIKMCTALLLQYTSSSLRLALCVTDLYVYQLELLNAAFSDAVNKSEVHV
jgi:hypothetical protein